MVFESLVVDLINKYLGDFVENLDKSQLKIGIWGGDVVLQNLDLKESALDDLDLPVRIKAGHIGKLTLKIPWKNLYTEAVVASIDGIYALAVPNAAIKYDAEKEEKSKQESKQKKLQQIEVAKKAAMEMGKEKDPKKDSFAEKMATQIIKNLQIHIKNIHVRYEDSYTNPQHPFSIGVSLGELLFQTTDENWKPCILKEAVTQIFKLIKLDGLSVYWNSKSQMYSSLSKPQMLEKLRQLAVKDSTTPFQFLIKPISSVAHLKLNTKPELAKYTIPKAFLTVVFDEIAIGLSKNQYNDVLEMLESFERMYLMSVYRKYRPEVPLHKNAKTWWHFAQESILEETVRRRRRMFSWTHIIKHRMTMKKYREAYVKKLGNPKKVSKDLQNEIDEYEKFLDVFCITLMRGQAEVEAAKLGAKKAEEKSKGWFGGMFGGKKKKAEKEETKDIQEQWAELYNDEEKKKLYDAIGYQENESDPTLPKEFVAVRLVTKLNNLSLTLNDESKAYQSTKQQRDPQILKLQLKDVFASVGQRPADSAVQVEAKMDKLMVQGSPQNGVAPYMVLSQNEEQKVVYSLVNFNLETNPLDRTCDTRVSLVSRPLQIIYDAVSINQMADFFKPPKEVYLKQLSKAAVAKFEQIKEQSATGLQHAIDLRKYTEIKVDLKPSYVIIPHGGYYKKEAVNMLILDLGNLRINSEKNQSGANKATAVEDVMSRAYDKFNIHLDRIQVLFSKPGENWEFARSQNDSDQHILHPLSIKLLLQKCMFESDPRMAQLKASGELPLVSLSMSDLRLQEVLQLVQSIPLPEPSEEEKELEIYMDSVDIPLDVNENQIVKKVVDVSMEFEEQEHENLERSESLELANKTQMELKFEIREVCVCLQEHTKSAEIPMLKLVIQSLGTMATIRKFDMNAEAYLGGIYLQNLKFKATESLNEQLDSLSSAATSGGPLINLINTPSANGTRLLTVKYHKANPEGPEFTTLFRNTEQTIDVTFTALEVLLHQEALLSVMKFADQLQKSLQTSSTSLAKDVVESKESEDMTEKDAQGVTKKAGKKKGKEKDPNVIDLKVNARLDEFNVAVCTNNKVITDMRIRGISVDVILQEAQTRVEAQLKAITIYDSIRNTKYPRIMEIEGDAVLKLKLTVYNNATEGNNYADMNCVDTSVNVELGCIRFVFLMRFVNDLLAYIDGFKVEELEDQIQAAKDKMKEASEVVAESAKGAVAKLQEKSPRIAIAVNMSAPVILVPQKSDSYNVLLIDFGHLDIRNSFQKIDTKDDSDIPAVLDFMKISLTSLKVVRAELDTDKKVHGQCMILEPVNVSLAVARNLAIAWYKDVPAVDINGQLQTVSATMSQSDFTVIMSMLNDNFNEGQSQDVKGKVKKADDISQKMSAEKQDLTKPSSGSPEITVTPPSSSDTYKVFTQLKFNFQITSLCATLYSGESTLTADGENCRSESNGLGKVTLQVISVDGHMGSDNSLTTKITLKDTILDDMRKSKKDAGILRMIERYSVEGTGLKDMIDVIFTQDPKQNKDVTVKICSIHLVVCLDFLMSLGDFFTKGMPESDPSAAIPSETNKAVAVKSPPPTSDLSVYVTMEKPEIILIEDQMNPASNALILETEVMFRMRMTPETQDMSASVRELQVVSCIYNERSKRKAQILNPCEISFYSKAPYGKAAHMDVSTSDLILNISPGTIRTIMAISAGLANKNEEEEKKSKHKIPEDLWAVKNVAESKFWFIKTVDQSEDISPPTTPDELIIDEGEREEQLIIKVPNVVVKLEGGIGKRTVPLLIAESSFDAQIKDWSRKLSVESNMMLEVAYYNEKLSVWEPLIEPVIDNSKVRKWDLHLEVVMNDDIPLDEEEEEEDSKNIVLPPPKMSINIKSEDPLEVMMSKTCLEVLQNLGKAFGDAYQLVTPAEEAGKVLSPYVIENHTGLQVIMKLDNAFEMPDDAKNGKITLTSNKPLPLYGKKRQKALIRQASVIKATQEGEEKKFIFQIEQYNATREVTIKRAEKRLYSINHKSYPGDEWAIVCSTDTPIGQKIIQLRSIVQIRNDLPDPVEVFSRNEKKLTSCGIVQPGELLNVSLFHVYTPSGEFVFKPINTPYDTSKDAVSWRSAETSPTTQVTCPSSDGHSPYVISVRTEMVKIYHDETEQLSAKTYICHLSPTVIFHNLLNIPITFLLEGMAEEVSLSKGENKPLLNAMLGKSNIELRVPHYQGQEWHGRQLLSTELPELSMLTFQAYVGAQSISMNLGLHCKKTAGCLDVSLYSPYWMINKTRQTLSYKGSDTEDVLDHPHDLQEVVLFSFKQKTFFGSKKKEGKNTKESKHKKPKEWRQDGKASLKIGDSDWSDKFSLDTVGSSGTVQCKSKSRVYEVGVKIRLSNSGLTKICTFTPYYMLLNTSEETFLCTETTTEEWIEVPPKCCLPFWPVQSGKEMTMRAKVKGSEFSTTPFLMNKPHTTLMKLDNEFGGINVECQVTEAATVTTLTSYKHGMATILIVNNTENASIKFHQSGEKAAHILKPNETMLYTWENAVGKREIDWSAGEIKSQKSDLIQDGTGSFFINSDSKVYWVSFLDGMQRVLLYTDDLAIAINAQEAGELERIEQEINVSIQRMGVSLVNDYTQTEVAYLGITSSGIIWEEKKKRYKALNMKTANILETAYRKYVTELELGHHPPEKLTLENKMEVNFGEMRMLKPNKRSIRRSFQDGVWIQYKTSPHQLQLHAKINRLQLDNQTSGSVFPTVLAPIPPPKSVAAESVPKPFTEVSIMLRKHEHSQMLQFKYFKVLVQEMCVKVDQGFLNNVIDLFSSDQAVPREQEVQMMEDDVKKVYVELLEEAGLSLAEEQKNFYDYLHFSPIKIHLSFSLQGGGGDGKPTQIHANVINVFLQSVGVVLTDVQDVVFKLGYFQRQHDFYNQSQLTGEMGRHYASQAIKQVYVLVLGLDVLGNPFGLLRGMAEGVEDLFYEPYQGAIQGPEEFAEGLALGVRSLLGHAVGGAAGAVSRITGTIGKGIAALTLDDEYQKKRREAMNKRPANVREGFARGGKGLVMGVFDGVTGIVRKPIEGAQKEGVEGFFKGIGKGLVGVVTRPTSGVIDFASSSFEGIKRIAELSDEVGRLRPPRRFHSDKIIRPYNPTEAAGYAILQETEKGKYSDSDEYVAHVVITSDSKMARNVLIITDRRVIYAHRGEIFGHWDADWTYTWNELKENPKRSAKGVEFVLKDEKKKKFPFQLGSSAKRLEVHIQDTKLSDWVVKKIGEAIAMNRG